MKTPSIPLLLHRDGLGQCSCLGLNGAHAHAELRKVLTERDENRLRHIARIGKSSGK